MTSPSSGNPARSGSVRYQRQSARLLVLLTLAGAWGGCPSGTSSDAGQPGAVALDAAITPGPPGPQGPAGPVGPAGVATPGSGILVTGTQVSLDTTFTDALYWKLGGNSASTLQTIGTLGNAAIEFVVNAARCVRLEPGDGPNIIAGSSANSAAAGIQSATIAGGGSLDSPNRVTAFATTIAGGADNSATADYAAVPGGNSNTAAGTGSIALGAGALAAHHGQLAHAAGFFAQPGDAQACVYVLRGQTQEDVTVELFLDGAGRRITIPTETTMAFDILVAARTDLGGRGGFRVTGLAENEHGTTTLDGVTIDTIDSTGGGIEVIADDINDALVVRAIGAAGKKIRWVASVRTAEVSFP